MLRFAIVTLTLAAGLLTAGCGSESKTSNTDGKLAIVTTVGMITDIVERIGGERVSVDGLMGPGVDPHQYKASEGDVTRMMGADIIFYNGLHLEGAMTDVLKKMGGRVTTVAVGTAVGEDRRLSHETYEGAHDPHIWFDVSLWMQAAGSVRDALSSADTAGAAYYDSSSTRLMVELEELDAYVREQAQRVPEDQRVVITAHDAFNYFGRAYGFEVRGLQGISTAAEAGTGDVQALAEFIANRKIPAIFVESSVPPRNIEAVQAAVQARGFEVRIGGELFSDAMGTRGTPEGTYPGMVRHNINTIVSALLGQAAPEEEH